MKINMFPTDASASHWQISLSQILEDAQSLTKACSIVSLESSISMCERHHVAQHICVRKPVCSCMHLKPGPYGRCIGVTEPRVSSILSDPQSLAYVQFLMKIAQTSWTWRNVCEGWRRNTTKWCLGSLMTTRQLTWLTFLLWRDLNRTIWIHDEDLLLQHSDLARQFCNQKNLNWTSTQSLILNDSRCKSHLEHES